MIEIQQTSPKEFNVIDHAGFVRGKIIESIGFWVVQIDENTPKACESYDRAVVLAKEYLGCL